MTESQADGLSTITRIEQQKRNKRRYNIYLDDTYAFSVHEDVLVKRRLLKGSQLTQTHLAEVLQEEESNDAYNKAIRFLGVRPRSRKEVFQRLAKDGYEEALVEAILQRLDREGYLNDREFARMWSEERVALQKKGKAWIRQELLQKGIDQELIQETLQQLDPEEELQSAVSIGRKKWRSTSGEPIERKRKTGAFLLRRGYSVGIVQQVLKKIINEDNN